MRSLRKILTRLRGMNFSTSSTRFASSFIRQPTVSNVPKWYKTHQNISLGSNGVDRLCSLRKSPTRLRGTNFCTSLARFAPSFVRQPNGPECTQIVRKAPKHQFRVQWGGSGAFGAKNSDAISFSNFCTNSNRFILLFVWQPKGPRCTQIV